MDSEQRNPRAIIHLQTKVPPHTSFPRGIQVAAEPTVLFGCGVFCPKTMTLLIFWLLFSITDIMLSL